MGGFFGITKRNSECVNELFYGVDYNSHLGTRRAGMATNDNGRFVRSIHNIENTYFRTKFEPDLHEFSGKSGIGVISDTDAQPIIINCHLGKFAIVTVAKINNIKQLQDELLNHGHHFCEHSNDIVNPTELVAALICEGKDFTDGINNVFNKVKGSCSMLILTSDSIIAARDRFGRTPIAIGRNDSGYALASESCAFANLGFEMIRQLGPGEIVSISAENGETVLKQPNEEMQICAFLWTYYGYPPCEYEGRNVDEMRYDNGFLHAKLVIVDDTLASVGTANMDYRSLTDNLEVTAFIRDRETVRQLAATFDDDLASCRRITRAEWRPPLWRRTLGDVLRLVSPLM